MPRLNDNEPRQMVSFDKPKLEDLEKSHRAAIRAGNKTFMFEGHEYLVDYAKYMILFLQDKLK
jgi:hypothetical protein